MMCIIFAKVNKNMLDKKIEIMKKIMMLIALGLLGTTVKAQETTKIPTPTTMDSIQKVEKVRLETEKAAKQVLKNGAKAAKLAAKEIKKQKKSLKNNKKKPKKQEMK